MIFTVITAVIFLILRSGSGSAVASQGTNEKNLAGEIYVDERLRKPCLRLRFEQSHFTADPNRARGVFVRSTAWM